jgi:malate/lactate dehydrogenase
MLGLDQPVHLKLLDIEPVMPVLKGTCMELQDCAYPLLLSVTPTSDYKVAFTDMDIGIFLGGFPRKAGMERKELMSKNCGIFKGQGEVLNQVAKPTGKFD